MAESRLRAARIWGGYSGGELSPLVFHIDYGARKMTFRKEVWEPLSGELHIADVWTHSLSGWEAEISQRQRVSTLIDRFILEYLRVNEGTAGDGPGRDDKVAGLGSGRRSARLPVPLPQHPCGGRLVNPRAALDLPDTPTTLGWPVTGTMSF